MIHGFICSSEEKNHPFILGSFFVELEEKLLQESWTENSVYQFINDEQGMGCFIGSHSGKFILIVLSDCDRMDFYQNIVFFYLYSSNLSIEVACRNIYELIRREDSLTSVLLMEGKDVFYISMMNSSDAVIMPLTSSSFYEIK
jgi:hypothetical protein